MTDVDLSLIPINELTAEIERRCDVFIAAIRMNCADERGGEIKTKYGKGSWAESVGLAEILKNDCLNNWNGELDKLQRLNDEDDS